MINFGSLLPCHPASYTLNVWPPIAGNRLATAGISPQFTICNHSGEPFYDDDYNAPACG